MAEKEVLQITLIKARERKTRFGQWFHNRFWFEIWGIYKPRFLAWSFGLLISKETKRKLYDGLEIHIIDQTDESSSKLR